MVDTPVFLLSGTPGVGKSSVATALMRRFPFGIHIPVDDLREWVVSGIAHPVPVWTDETSRQFGLARQVAAFTAFHYTSAGFAVAIDDILYPAEAQTLFVEPLSRYHVYKVLLHPPLEVALTRNAQRTTKNFDPSFLCDTIRDVHNALSAQPFHEYGWLVIDNSYLTLEQTVDAILAHV